MKKLMIAAAIVCAAALAQASTYNWKASSDWCTGTDDVGINGSMVYVFDAYLNPMSTVVSALSNDGADILSQAVGSVAVKEDAFALTGQGFSGTTGLSSDPTDNYVSAYLIFVDNTGKKFYTDEDFEKVVKLETASRSETGKALFGYGDIYTGVTSSWSNIASGDVPEPTSGLLLLLGMAGLALRRRRA